MTTSNYAADAVCAGLCRCAAALPLLLQRSVNNESRRDPLTKTTERPSDERDAASTTHNNNKTKLNETNDGEHQAQQEGAGVRCPPAFCLCLALSVLAALFLSHASSPQHALAHCNNSSAVDVGVSVVVKLPYYANTHKTHAKAKHKSKHTHTAKNSAKTCTTNKKKRVKRKA